MPLSLRLHAARELLQHSYPLHEYQCDQAAADIESQFVKTSDSKIGAGSRERRDEAEADNGAALDAYFLRVRTELEELAKPEASRSLVAQAKYDALMEATSKALCTSCSSTALAGRSQHLCRWTTASEAADIAAVGAHGACLEPTRELFQVACEVSRAAYNQACGVAPTQAVVLGTICASRPNDMLEVSVNGVTRELGRAKRMVELAFHVESLAPDDYLAQLYVLFHEVFVHALCGIALDSEYAYESAAFHEGWMDSVAADVLESLEQYGVAKSHPAVRFKSQFVEKMRTMRGYRFDTARAASELNARQWRKGCTAREAMGRVLREAWEELEIEAGETVSHAAEKAARDLRRLSVQLNASGASDSERGAFTAALNRLFSRCHDDESVELLRKHSQVVEFAKKFAQGDSWESLVASVVLYAEQT